MNTTTDAPDVIDRPSTADPTFKKILGELVTPTRDIQGQENEKDATAEPPRWAVVLINDNSTFPQFVEQVLQEAFRLSPAKAVKVMMTAHTQGECLVIITTRDEAETRLQTAREMIAKARPGRDFAQFGDPNRVCELQFSLREESKE